MDSETRAKQRRELSPQDFQRLLSRLDPDSARASAKYTLLRERLVRYSFSHDEHVRAEELADNAMDAIARKADLEYIRDVEQFAVGVLRMLLLAHKRQNPGQLLDEPDKVVGDPGLENTIVNRLDRERKELCFVNCMKRLEPSERRLIFEYYPNENRKLEERRKHLAVTIGIQTGALATRMNRLRSKLEQCCLNCYHRSVAGWSLSAAASQLKKM
jgi:hypothetical protein